MKNEKRVNFGKRKALIFAVLFVMLVSVGIGCATAEEWHVYPGQRIQTTINNAGPSDTIYVHAGNYTENVVVNKSLTLKGVGMPEINGQIPDVHEYNLLLSDTQGDATFIDIGRVWVEKGISLSHEPMLIFSVEYYTTKNSRALRIYMDTDNDPATGYSLNDIGADYRVCPGGFLFGLPIAEKWKSESEKWTSINCYYDYDLCRNCPEGADARYYIDFQDANFQLANATTIRLVFESFYGSAYPLTVDDVAPDSGYVQLDVQKWKAMSVEPTITVKSDDCIIEGFKLTGSDKYGLLILSDNSQISNNTISNNRMGLSLKSSNNNIIDNNTVISNEWDGILVSDSTNNTVKNNNVSDCGSGVCLYSSSHNLIYNNYFNNINNAYDDGNNIWNISKTAGTNVIGGPYIGGNYWSDYTGVDTDGDGLGDTMIPYDSSGDITNGGDWLPLFQAGEKLPVNNTKWYFGPSLNVARHGLDAIEYVNKIYAIGGWGGSTVLEVFDPISNSWTYLSPLPVGQEGLAAARVDDTIYTFGSYGWKDTVQIYDISNDKWSAGPNLPKGMYGETAESIGAMIYIIGGYSNGLELDTLYILDTATNTWSQGASMPKFAQVPSSAVYNGEIYVFPVNYKYDPSTDSWTPFTGPPSGLEYGSEAVTIENNIYLIGGNAGYTYEAYNTTEIYDPSTDSWTTGPELNIGRYQFGATHINGKIYAIGGRNENATFEKTVEILNGEVLISNVSVTNITTNSATITWDTNEPSNSLIKYGTESRNYTLQKYDSMNVTSHSGTLIGLIPNTTYYFVVNTTYQSGNSNESTERSFITLHSYAKRDAGVTSTITPASPADLAAYLPPEYKDTDISDAVVLNVNVTDITPDTTDAAYTDITINVGSMDIETCKVFKTGIGFLPEVEDVTTLPTVSGEPAFSRDLVNKTVTVRLYVGDPLLGVIPAAAEAVFDTGEGTYPSIMGTHNGTIIPSRDINVSKMYTYSCAGTGGHSESIKLYENETLIASGVWEGYGGDWHNITIHNESGASYVMLFKGRRYNYTIVTGSYPQIIHAPSKAVTGGTITCTYFVYANGKVYKDRIPAVRLE